MKILDTIFEACVVIEPRIFEDKRGFFTETFQAERYAREAGITQPFVQDNFSRSGARVLRGLHFQRSRPQGRLVSVVRGKVFDVAVDIRNNSTTFGKWDSVILSDVNRRQLWVPPGFAHGFLVLSEGADLVYKCTDYYDVDDEGQILWSDPELAINWPISDPILSDKDAAATPLNELQL